MSRNLRSAKPDRLLLLVPLLALACSQPSPVVENGLEVSFLYEARDESGELVDANPEGTPITFIVGAGQLQGKVEKELLGLRRGDKKSFVVADAYGVYDEKKTGLLPVTALPDGAQIGDALDMADGSPARIKEIGEAMVVLDFNHPLASQVIAFQVQVAEVRKPVDAKDEG